GLPAAPARSQEDRRPDQAGSGSGQPGRATREASLPTAPPRAAPARPPGVDRSGRRPPRPPAAHAAPGSRAAAGRRTEAGSPGEASPPDKENTWPRRTVAGKPFVSPTNVIEA